MNRLLELVDRFERGTGKIDDRDEMRRLEKQLTFLSVQVQRMHKSQRWGNRYERQEIGTRIRGMLEAIEDGI